MQEDRIRITQDPLNAVHLELILDSEVGLHHCQRRRQLTLIDLVQAVDDSLAYASTHLEILPTEVANDGSHFFQVIISLHENLV